MHDGFEIKEFLNIELLHDWILINHSSSKGIWVRIYKIKSSVESIKFIDLLEEGLCFGWSESLRHSYDNESYLQKFTPRKTKGTLSKRNLDLVKKLTNEGRMTPDGIQALGL